VIEPISKVKVNSDIGLHLKTQCVIIKETSTTITGNDTQGGSEKHSTMSYDDWRYNDFNTKLRQEVLKILLSKYGGQMEDNKPKYSSQSIYECAHDWISQGHKTSFGITKYYEAYYAKDN